MSTLFDETCLGSLRLKNRLVRSATWEAMADEKGKPTLRLIRIYRELADGGIGLIITGATSITTNATRLPNMLALTDDSAIIAFRHLTREVHKAGSPVVIQLTHVGTGGEWWTPDGTSENDLQKIIRAFGDSACRAQLAGFDGVQIHSGHGFFLSQFLSARKNTRADRYGGEVENRARLLMEIYDEIRARTGKDFTILVKINCTDFEQDDGVFDACRYACRELALRGISAIEITGGVSGMPFPPPGLPYKESVFRDYAAEIARIVEVPVILVGLNRTPAVLRNLLESTCIGYFSLSRPLLRQPGLPGLWQENADEPSACTSCDMCRQNPEDGIACPFRQ